MGQILDGAWWQVDIRKGNCQSGLDYNLFDEAQIYKVQRIYSKMLH